MVRKVEGREWGSGLSGEDIKFITELRSFHEKHGFTPLRDEPTLGRRELNFRLLYDLVQRRGGFEAVTSSKQWKAVARDLGLPDTATNCSTALKKQYWTYLRPWDAYRRGHIMTQAEASTKCPIQSGHLMTEARAAKRARRGNAALHSVAGIAAAIAAPGTSDTEAGGPIDAGVGVTDVPGDASSANVAQYLNADSCSVCHVPLTPEQMVKLPDEHIRAAVLHWPLLKSSVGAGTGATAAATGLSEILSQPQVVPDTVCAACAETVRSLPSVPPASGADMFSVFPPSAGAGDAAFPDDMPLSIGLALPGGGGGGGGLATTTTTTTNGSVDAPPPLPPPASSSSSAVVSGPVTRIPATSAAGRGSAQNRRRRGKAAQPTGPSHVPIPVDTPGAVQGVDVATGRRYLPRSFNRTDPASRLLMQVRNPYPSMTIRRYLSLLTGMVLDQVTFHFQYRRKMLRVENIDVQELRTLFQDEQFDVASYDRLSGIDSADDDDVSDDDKSLTSHDDDDDEEEEEEEGAGEGEGGKEDDEDEEDEEEDKDQHGSDDRTEVRHGQLSTSFRGGKPMRTASGTATATATATATTTTTITTASTAAAAAARLSSANGTPRASTSSSSISSSAVPVRGNEAAGAGVLSQGQEAEVQGDAADTSAAGTRQEPPCALATCSNAGPCGGTTAFVVSPDQASWFNEQIGVDLVPMQDYLCERHCSAHMNMDIAFDWGEASADVSKDDVERFMREEAGATRPLS